MMRRVCLMAVLLAIPLAHAQTPAPPTPGLLPTSLARSLLEQDPSVEAARAGLEVARQDAELLQRSPYEWNARLSSQRRTLQEGARYQEWNAGVERPLRLPRKASADQGIAQATLDEAEARHGEALHEAARELLGLWLDTLAAQSGLELASATRQSVQDNLSAVEKRLRAGDASKLDLSLAQAELAEQQRLENDAKTQATVAGRRLQARFPGLRPDSASATWPAVPPLHADLAYWRERILSESDEFKIVQTQLQKAEAEAERARAEKIPDPTLGIYTASEVGGRERITGLSLSMPIPDGRRGLRATRAAQQVEVLRQQLESKKRELVAVIDSAVAHTEGAYTSLRLADAGAQAMQDNARLVQRAYSLGEAELQALLSARRQASLAAQNALSAKAAAAKNYYLLLIDAHLIWDLHHDSPK